MSGIANTPILALRVRQLKFEPRRRPQQGRPRDRAVPQTLSILSNDVSGGRERPRGLLDAGALQPAHDGGQEELRGLAGRARLEKPQLLAGRSPRRRDEIKYPFEVRPATFLTPSR